MCAAGLPSIRMASTGAAYPWMVWMFRVATGFSDTKEGTLPVGGWIGRRQNLVPDSTPWCWLSLSEQ